MDTQFHKAEIALARYKRINHIDESVSVNGLIQMLQQETKAFDRKDLSDKDALRTLMLLIKDDNLAFLERVRDYIKSNGKEIV